MNVFSHGDLMLTRVYKSETSCKMYALYILKLTQLLITMKKRENIFETYIFTLLRFDNKIAVNKVL